MSSSELVRLVLEAVQGGKLEKSLAVSLLREHNRPAPIAVIGMGVRHAAAGGYEELWRILEEGNSLISRLGVDRTRDLRPLFGNVVEHSFAWAKGGFLPDIKTFDHDVFGYTQQEACALSPHSRLVMSTAFRALEDAGIPTTFNDVGVFVGYNHTQDQRVSYFKLIERNSHGSDLLNQLIGSWTSGLATRVSMAFDLHGPSYVVDSSCPSSMVSVIAACEALRRGACKVAIAGGLYLDLAPLKQFVDVGFSMAQSDESVTKLFDRRQCGARSGELCGFVVLKEFSQAVKDGDRIHSVIRGHGQNANGSEAGFWSSSPKAIARAVEEAVTHSGVDVEDIGLLLGEGFANKMEESLETAGLAMGLRKHSARRQFCAMTAVTPNLGYLNSAVGITNVLVATLALRHRAIPMLPHFDSPTDMKDLVDSPFYIPVQTAPWIVEEGHCRVAMAYSYGFGGTNNVIVLEEASDPAIGKSRVTEELLFCASATREHTLDIVLRDDIAFLRAAPESDLAAICYCSCSRRRHHGGARVAVTGRTREEIISGLESALTGTPNANTERRVYDKPLGIRRRPPLDLIDVRDGAIRFVSGAPAKFADLYAPVDRRFVPLPAYPLESIACWVDPQPAPKRSLKRLIPPRNRKGLDL